MKRLAIVSAIILLSLPLAAQEYQVPQISISKDKVRVGGKSYYAHVVTAKQTLYSICKTYRVTQQDIFEANKNLNLETEGLKAGQVLLIPTTPTVIDVSEVKTPEKTEQQDNKALFPSKKNEVENEGQGAAAQAPQGIDPLSEEFEFDIPDVIKVAILLPFNATGTADSKSVDFYSGVLLAARDLGELGLDINISTHDISGGKLSPLMLSGADLILGPISEKDVKAAARMVPHGKYIISPLEPKTAGMADSLRVIQAPTPVKDQFEEAARWAVEDYRHGDSLVVIREKGKALSANSKAMLGVLVAKKARYSTISYDLLDGLQVQPRFVSHASSKGVTRYLIASEDESFVNDAMRNINLMAYKKQAVVLYGPSRVRSYGTIETENLHNIQTHIATTYQIDYNKPEVQAFVKAYRALFDCEPNQFAFHGYDCMTYFCNMCNRYGRKWYSRLSRGDGRGLQTDFTFERDSAMEGRVNSAVRRVVYTPDYQIILL